MAYPVEWVMDSPELEWEYDPSTNTIVATTTTVVRTYVHLGRVHEGVAPDVPPFSPPAPAVFLGAFTGQPLGLWDFPPEPLPNFPPEPLPDIPMEPMSPALPVAEPQPDIPVIEISSTATFRAAAASQPLPKYHPSTDPSSEEDPSEVRSSSASYTPGEAGPSRCTRRVEVISRHPLIIRTPRVPRGRGARRSRISGPRHP